MDPVGAEYLFKSRWLVPATIEELKDLVFDPLSLPEWWPSVFLDFRLIAEGGEHAVGTRALFRSKGWMPHVIILDSRVSDGGMDPPHLRIEVAGDLNGYAYILATEESGETTIDIDWCIDLRKASIKWLAPVIWPLLVSNHQWVMAQGYRSLLLEIDRRRCATDTERRRIPAPPGPVFPHNLPLLRNRPIPYVESETDVVV